MKFKIDLHTHSSTSYDGGITYKQYQKLLRDNADLVIAITDHNKIGLVLDLHAEFGERVIVGQEIMSKHGEIIGLFVSIEVPAKQSALETCQQIKAQGGLVYIPHPLEVTRHGLSLSSLQDVLPLIDIIEVYNARTREPWLRAKVQQFAETNNVGMAASSDAHGLHGFSTSYGLISEIPTPATLVHLLRSAELTKRRAPLWSLLDPLRNKIRHNIV